MMPPAGPLNRVWRQRRRRTSIKGLHGVRKARIALPGRGKRGGGRVVYFVQVTPLVLFMLTAYPKNGQDDLTHAQCKAILAAIDRIREGST